MTQETVRILTGDVLETLKGVEDKVVQTCVTSPPYYGLRDYGVAGQIGLEETPQAYIERLVQVFREVRRVMRDDGTLWLNLGDSYNGSGKGANADGSAGKAGKISQGNRGTQEGKFTKSDVDGLKPKDLLMIPARVALALQADGWYLRSEIVWHKPNPMPESVRDRPTKAHEMIYLLAKSQKYYYDAEAVREPSVDKESYSGRRKRGEKSIFKNNGYSPNMNPQTFDKGGEYIVGKTYPFRNRRDVWTVTTKPYKGAHFATFPPDLIEPCILAGSKAGDLVLDPFMGSGTTMAVALKHGRRGLGCELNPKYVELAKERLAKV